MWGLSVRASGRYTSSSRLDRKNVKARKQIREKKRAVVWFFLLRVRRRNNLKSKNEEAGEAEESHWKYLLITDTLRERQKWRGSPAKWQRRVCILIRLSQMEVATPVEITTKTSLHSAQSYEHLFTVNRRRHSFVLIK